MPDTPIAQVTTASSSAPKTVGLFQDPHFWGVLNTVGGLITAGTSYLSVIPTTVQPFVLGAGILWTAGAQIFHIFGLVNPASTQTPVVK